MEETVIEEKPETKAVAKKEETAVAKEERTNWARLHGSWKDRIERMLPEPRMIDQFMYCAETQYGKNKEAFDRCTPVSLLTCMLTCAKFGILPDGRNAYLIPYGSDCTLQFDYKGLVHVVIRDGTAKKVHAETVCENDSFVFRNGRVEMHEIHLPRGKVLGAYCDVTLPDGDHQYELMDIDEIEAIKKCSKGSSSPSSPWNRFFGEMAKKTVFRRCTKWLKLSPDVMDAIHQDDEASFDFTQQKQTQSLFAPTKQIEATQKIASATKVEEKQTVGQIQEAELKKEAVKKNLPF